MRLYLVQHGLAKNAVDDSARPLSRQGREDVTRTAGFLSLFEKPRPLKIMHSGKLRAQQTAMMFAEAWGGIACAEATGLAANDHPSVWADRLAAMTDDMMLVGHLPHLQRLAGLLICDDIDREAVCLRNGGVLCLENRNRSWSVLWQINPSLFYGED